MIWKIRLLLRATVVAFGTTCLLIYPLAMAWPSRWAWDPAPLSASRDYFMLAAVYATLGAFSLIAAMKPERHRSLISFAAVSSIAHELTMAFQAAAT